MRLLSIIGCDLVLEAEWLETLGFIGLHFKNKVMEFQIDGHKYCLVGLHSSDSPTILTSTFSTFYLLDISSLLASILSASSIPDIVQPTLQPLESLMDNNSDLFTASTCLPPKWAINRRITLLSNT